MKLLSWNVNGIRAVLGKGFAEFVAAEQPDILCVQETKARPEQVQLPLELAGYQAHWDSAEKPGYSGVAVFTRIPPLAVRKGVSGGQAIVGRSRHGGCHPREDGCRSLFVAKLTE